MIKNASRLWGFVDTESENSFDPIVGMIIGALASELDKLSGDINDSDSRIVEKLVELLTPEPVTGPMPSHSILRAQPVQPVFEIYPEFQFYLYKKLKNPNDPSKSEEKTIFFSPAGNYKLFNARIDYFATGTKIFEMQDEGFKEMLMQAEQSRRLPQSSIWMGISMDSNIESLEGMSIYFNIKSELHEETFYHSLNRAKWYLNGKSVMPYQGFTGGIQAFRKDLDDLVNQEVNITAKVSRHIQLFYRNHFISFEPGNFKLDEYEWGSPYPEAFNTVFDSKDLGNLPPNLFWIEVQFTQPIPPEILEDVFCSLNCFPVLNRKKNEFTQTSRDNINIIPLETEDSFFDMKKVSNSSGKLYTMKSFSSLEDIEKGSYLLRQGGISRFDSRNAREMLNYLLELLRDESAAFSVLGTDMISSNLRELNQTIARLEQRLTDSNVSKENMSYLMLKAAPQDEIVFVEFWSTNGSFGNKIKAGNKLFVYEGSDIKQESVLLMLQTVGGREKMDTDDRLNAYRKALLTKGRIVTPEDVKALCYEHFGKILEKVEVSKGISRSASISSGFVRTIDVSITISKRTSTLTDEELKFMIEDLKVKLEDQSANIIPYRVFLK